MTFAVILAQAAQATGQAITEVAKGATQGNPYEELGVFIGQIPMAGWVVWGIEKLKASKYFPWVNCDSAQVNRTISLIAAFLGSAGLNFAMQGSVMAGGVITITFPALGNLVHFLFFDVTRSYLAQQMIYKNLSTSNVVGRIAVNTGTGSGESSTEPRSKTEREPKT